MLHDKSKLVGARWKTSAKWDAGKSWQICNCALVLFALRTGFQDVRSQ